MDDHLDKSSADFEDILFFEFPSDHKFQVVFHVVKGTIEATIIFDDFFDDCDLFGFVVVH